MDTPSHGRWGILKVSSVTSGVFRPSESKALLPGVMPRSDIEVKNGDILVCRANGARELVGSVVLVSGTPSKLMLSDKTLRLVADPAVIYPEYLYHYLTSWRIKRQIAQLLSGSTGQSNISQNVIRSLRVIIPPLALQRKAAEILDAADDHITALLRLLRKQHTLRESLLCSLIPVSPDPQELGSGWSLVPLAEVVPSADYGISSPLTLDGVGIPTLRMNNLAFGRIKVDEIKFATTGVPDNLTLRERDVLFNRTNSFEHVGRTAIWRNELERAAFASYLVRLNPDLRRLMPEYLVRWLNHPAIQQRIRRIATPGVQQVNINPTSLRKIHIEIPTNVSRQAEIVQVLDECDQTADRISAELADLKLVKKGLMDDLLTGRVRVTSAS